MKAERILSIVLVMVLLASAVPMAITPAAAVSEVYEEKIAGDADENGELTKEELVSAILPYMLDEGADFALDDVGDAAYVYAYWDGKPRTITDQIDREVTFYRPVERVVALGISQLRDVVILGAADKVVGIDSTSAYGWYFCMQAHPELMDIPTVGGSSNPNVEAILNLKPDVAFVSTSSHRADSIQEKTGILAVSVRGVRCNIEDFSGSYKSLRIGGKVLGKEDRAEWLNSYVEDELDRIRKITNEIPEEEKPKVYALVWSGIKKTCVYGPVEWAGGNNVAKEHLQSYGLASAQINPEQVLVWNPDVIFLGCTGDRVAKLLETHPGLGETKAVKEGRVYQIFGPYCCWDLIQMPVETYYMAKLLHPDRFQDLDVEKEANRMLKEVYGADDLYNKVQEARGLELYRWE